MIFCWFFGGLSFLVIVVCLLHLAGVISLEWLIYKLKLGKDSIFGCPCVSYVSSMIWIIFSGDSFACSIPYLNFFLIGLIGNFFLFLRIELVEDEFEYLYSMNYICLWLVTNNLLFKLLVSSCVLCLMNWNKVWSLEIAQPATTVWGLVFFFSPFF